MNSPNPIAVGVIELLAFAQLILLSVGALAALDVVVFTGDGFPRLIHIFAWVYVLLINGLFFIAGIAALGLNQLDNFKKIVGIDSKFYMTLTLNFVLIYANGFLTLAMLFLLMYGTLIFLRLTRVPNDN